MMHWHPKKISKETEEMFVHDSESMFIYGQKYYEHDKPTMVKTIAKTRNKKKMMVSL